MSYNSPLLVELLAEIDLATPGFTGGQIVSCAKSIEDAGFSNIEFSGFAAVESSTLAPRIRCWSEDRKRLVQLSPATLVVNQVGDYPGWSEFRSLFDQVTGIAASASGFEPAFVNLRAIDSLSVDADGFALGDYFSCDGQYLPRWYADCAEGCDMSLGRGFPKDDGYNRQISLRLRKKGDEFSVRMETSFKAKIGTGDLGITLDTLHDKAVSLFEELVTDKTRHRMGGEK